MVGSSVGDHSVRRPNELAFRKPLEMGLKRHALDDESLGTLGGLFGVVLGWPLTVLTVQSLKRISYLDMDVTVEPGTVMITFLGALLVSLAASVYPMVRQGATDLMEAVKYE